MLLCLQEAGPEDLPANQIAKIKNLSFLFIITNSGGTIALHKMKIQTREAHHLKAYDHIYHVLARQQNPREGS